MMQNKIQLVVFLAGILSKVSGDLYRFVLIEEPKTWAEAQSYCRETYKDLATVQSDEDRAKLKEAANTVSFRSDAWTGFSSVVWRWSYQNKVVSYTKWESWEPNMSNANIACVFVKRSGQWGDTSCTVQKYFFCQTKSDTLYYKFAYVERSMNWYDAQKYCRSYHVDLATIADDTENKHLAYVLYTDADYEAWIGLSGISWHWSDNTRVSWSSVKWESGQPDNVNDTEVCARSDSDGQLAGDSCSTPLPYYCCEDTKIQGVRLALKSYGLLDESAVMEAIEKKMKQILSDQDVKIRSSITWSAQPDEKITQETPTACEEFDQYETLES